MPRTARTKRNKKKTRRNRPRETKNARRKVRNPETLTSEPEAKGMKRSSPGGDSRRGRDKGRFGAGVCVGSALRREERGSEDFGPTGGREGSNGRSSLRNCLIRRVGVPRWAGSLDSICCTSASRASGMAGCAAVNRGGGVLVWALQ